MRRLFHSLGPVCAAWVIYIVIAGLTVRAAEYASPLFCVDTVDEVMDTDGDGMSDAWETRHGLNIYSNDAAVDFDLDGRSNLDEYNSGTNPTLNDWLGPDHAISGLSTVDTGAANGGYAADSDGDGMPDWWEAKYSLEIWVDDSGDDADEDGLTNLEEYNSGLIPTQWDGLAIKSGEYGLFIVNTGGRWIDTDGDGIPDWWESLYTGSVTGLNPEDDTDGDGMCNLDEFLSKCNPVNAASAFQLLDVAQQELGSTNQWILSWDSEVDRRYRVYVQTNLTMGWPTSPVYQVDGDGATQRYTNTVSDGGQRFFRITAELTAHP